MHQLFWCLEKELAFSVSLLNAAWRPYSELLFSNANRCNKSVVLAVLAYEKGGFNSRKSKQHLQIHRYFWSISKLPPRPQSCQQSQDKRWYHWYQPHEPWDCWGCATGCAWSGALDWRSRTEFVVLRPVPCKKRLLVSQMTDSWVHSRKIEKPQFPQCSKWGTFPSGCLQVYTPPLLSIDWVSVRKSSWLHFRSSFLLPKGQGSGHFDC